MSSPRTITYSSRRNAPSPASVLSAAGVFARFALPVRWSRRWQNIPKPSHPVRTRRSHRPPRFCPQRAFLRGSRCSCASRADDGAFPKPHTLRQDTALPSPASVLSAAGVFARFALPVRRPRRWQNIPKPHTLRQDTALPSPASVLSAAGVFARFALPVRWSRRWQNIPKPSHPVRTRRSHRPPRFCPQRAFLRGSRCSCASRADDGASQSRPAPSGHGASARGRPLRHEFRRGRLSSLPTPPSPFHVSTGNAACPEALCR